MKKLDLNKIVKDDVLVGQPVKHTIKFKHFDEEYQVDVFIKPLSYQTTEPLFKRLTQLDNDKTLVAEWISLAVVNEKGENYLTVDDIQHKFNQQLAMAIFNKILGVENLNDKKDEGGKSN